jgi:hypothetical protein
MTLENIRKKIKSFISIFARISMFKHFPSVRHRPDQNRVTWETPSSKAIPLLQEPIGVLASYVTHVEMQV